VSTAPRLPHGERAALWALMAGNIAIGTGVIAPAGMMNSLSAGFGYPPSVIGHLITYGAIVLFIGAPLSAWLTNRIGRRMLLTASLGIYVAGHAASALAPDFDSLLIIRLLMIGSAAVFTPQAASVVQFLVAPERRSAAIAFVFLGWSVASGLSIPLASVGAAYIGWRSIFAILAVLFAVAAFGVWKTIPSGLMAPRMSGAAWGRVARHAGIFTVVSVTAIQMAGQFTLFPYIPADLVRTAGSGPETIAIVLSLFGLAGVVGNTIAVRMVGRYGTVACVTVSLIFIAAGLATWPLFSSTAWTVAISASLMGIGFAASNSMQQARLGALAPDLASVSIALNTSAIYVGQAAGSAMGGQILDAGQEPYLPVVGVVFVLTALAVSTFAAVRLRA
jgi:predicted MFS family arabinose efflux permease